MSSPPIIELKKEKIVNLKELNNLRKYDLIYQYELL